MSNKMIPCLVVTSLVFVCLFQDQTDTRPLEPSPGESRILAKVGQFSISERAVLRSLKKTLPNFEFEVDGNPRPLSSAQQQMFDGTLKQLIDQQIVYAFLADHGRAASHSEIQIELDDLDKELKPSGLDLSEFLKKEKTSLKELEFEIGWNLVWPRYLKKVLTDDYLEQHYQRNRPRFDGSKIHVAHLLIKIDESRQSDDAIRIARGILEKLNAKESGNWNRLVAEFSEAPTGKSGGDIGWIEFHQPMPVKFSEAAFLLSEGEVSQPVITSFGVHLIHCLEIKQGKIQWRDALDQVREDATRKLFQQIADENREKVKVELLVREAPKTR